MKPTFAGGFCPANSEAAEAFAALAAGRRQVGRPISQADAQIAAIARSRGAALATRNVPDFEGLNGPRCSRRNVSLTYTAGPGLRIEYVRSKNKNEELGMAEQLVFKEQVAAD